MAASPAGRHSRLMIASRTRDIATCLARAGLALLMLNADDPFRLALAVLVLALQLPMHRVVYAWAAQPTPDNGARA
jgi:hypothetical protein